MPESPTGVSRSSAGSVGTGFGGAAFDATRAVRRGKSEDGGFSLFHYAGDRLVAIDSINRASDHMLGRKLLAAGISVSPEQAADEGVDLKALVVPARG
jgi:3-phenylpropionate/trans-cinnamate dioxygenase ferredoxin reductase subunit